MVDIVLATVNATYSHPSFGLRCLRANLGGLRGRSVLLEFDGRRPVAEIADTLLAPAPRIVALGVYIWNTVRLTALAAELRRRAPAVALVLGGPEISHETDDQPIARDAACIVRGEGEAAFPDVCRTLLEGDRPPRIVDAPPPDLARLALPYDEYDDADLARRFAYVETTRGCPYGCEYCLSSLDRHVREWPLEAVLAAFDRLLARGARRFKFVDRTFNLDPDRAARVMDFFLARMRPGLVVHFEMVPERFPDPLRERIRRFPPGALRLEVGVQSFDADVAARVGRGPAPSRVEDALRFLRDETGALVHADLIAGLPGESLPNFGKGFDRLFALRPAEIQVGILKRLRGTPIGRHSEPWGLRFAAEPPYEVLATNDMPADQMNRLKRFARYWELTWNRGRFRRSLPRLWAAGGSPFEAFLAASDALHARFGRTHALTPWELAEGLQACLEAAGAWDAGARDAMRTDLEDVTGRAAPHALR